MQSIFEISIKFFRL